MTKGQGEARDHKYKLFKSLGGYGLGNQGEPSRFKLENITVVHSVYIGVETGTDQAVSSSTERGK
jgi:hypothetical protein